MKFDFIIGNPPYQEETVGTSDKAIYNYFMDGCFQLSDRVELITPGRFLFKAGNTPTKWNQERLQDEHFKVLHYVADSTIMFANTDIRGGVAITYRDSNKDFGAIGVFSPHQEIKSLLGHFSHLNKSLSLIIYLQNKFNLELLYRDFPELRQVISSSGNERRIVSSAFDKLSVFTEKPKSPDSIKIFGVTTGNKRTYKWIDRKYVEDNGNLFKYKVFLPKSNGSGNLGEVLSTPLIGQPLIGHTQTFISIGSFDTEVEAEACLKYVKSKFARVMLGILKITQDNPPEKWKYVPLQDFTSNSDIDWTASIAEIDRQLYAKYGLSDEEIAFIETRVKEMA